MMRPSTFVMVQLLLFQVYFCIAVTLPTDGETRGEVYDSNAHFYIAKKDADIPSNLNSSFGFDDEMLVMKGSENVSFVIAYEKSPLNPLLEWCFPLNFNESCDIDYRIIFDSFLVNASTNMIGIRLKKGILLFGLDKNLVQTDFDKGDCLLATRQESGKVMLNITSSTELLVANGTLEDVTGPALPSEESTMNQTAVQFDGNLCGTSIRIPGVVLVYQDMFENSTDGTMAQAKLISLTEMWIILGGLGLFVILFVIALFAGVYFYVRRAKRKAEMKKKAEAAERKMTRSMESVIQPLSKTNQVSNVKTAIPASEGLKTAEEKSIQESAMYRTAFPKMEIDPSKPFSKIMYWEYAVRKLPKGARPKYPEPKSIVPFLSKKYVDDSIPTSQYTPDCLLQLALREYHPKDRADKLLQAAIQANNELYDLGWRRHVHRRTPDGPREIYVTAPPKAEAWLANLKEGDFLRFIAEYAQKDITGADGEFEDNIGLWKLYLHKIGIPDCLFQACILGQSSKRRQFFVMALYFRFSEQINETPDELTLERIGYPCALLLDIFRDAHHFFDADRTTLTGESSIDK